MQRLLRSQPPSMNISHINQLHTCPQPNCRFNADANMGHSFAIWMAHVGALQPSASGAG